MGLVPTVLNVCCLAKATKERTQYSLQQQKLGPREFRVMNRWWWGRLLCSFEHFCCSNSNSIFSPPPLPKHIKKLYSMLQSNQTVMDLHTKINTSFSFLLGSVSLLQLRVKSFCQRFGLPCLLVESSHTNEACKE